MKIAPLALILTAGLSGLAYASPAQTETPTHSSNMCFAPSQIRSSTPISDREILFHMANGKIWKNTLRANCPGLKFENGFAWEIRGGEVCANFQTIYVLRRGTPCFLGDFTAYTPPPKPDEPPAQ